jgi:hypothetical protein
MQKIVNGNFLSRFKKLVQNSTLNEKLKFLRWDILFLCVLFKNYQIQIKKLSTVFLFHKNCKN